MTNCERRKKYPIGTKIKYVEADPTRASIRDIGKVGKIVGYHNCDYPVIFLPESKHTSCYSSPIAPASWATGWESIEILSQEGQLTFDFYMVR